jgi:polyhydroxyalkanoate synthesis regulator phasin
VPEETAHPYMPYVTNFVEHTSPTDSEQKNIELSLRIVKLEEDLKVHRQNFKETLDEKIQLHRQVGKLENDIKLLRQIVEVEGDITEAKTTLEIAKQNKKLAQEEMLQHLEELTKDLSKKHGVSVSVGLGASV